MFLLFVMVGVCALVVKVGKPTEAKTVRIGLLKDGDVLPVEVVWLVLKARLPEAVCRVPVRPAMATGSTLEVVPSILWVLLLESCPGPLIIHNFN